MSDLTDLQTLLAEAKAALHELLTGRQVASIGKGDRQVSYNRAQLSDLRAYIVELELQITNLGGTSARRKRRPVLVDF